MHFYPEIQGLRAIAILLVILSHGEVPHFQGGFVGVDVFFVLSGYLITAQILGEYASGGGVNLPAFYARRLRRLLPALVLMLTTAVLVAPWVLSEHAVLEQTASLAYAATWTSNFYFAFSEIDYFSELRNRDLFTHTWSLGLEEQFYLIWPILLLGAARGGDGKRKYLVAVITALFGISLFFSWMGSRSDSNFSYYLLPTRMWQFALGAVIWICPPDAWVWRALASKSDGLAWTGLALIGFSAMYIDGRMAYPGLWALVPSLGAVLVIASTRPSRKSLAANLLGGPVLVWIGDRSYSLYLWHWPVLMIGFEWGLKGKFVAVAGLCLLSVGLAAASYRYVELPFWKGRYRNLSTKHVFMSSIGVVLIPIAIAWNYSALLIEPKTGANLVAVVPSYSAANDVPSIYSEGCDTAMRNADVTPCFVGSRGGIQTVVLMGDSIGAQWTSMLPQIFQTPQWRVVVFTKSSCPMVDEDVVRANGKVFAICREWRENVLNYLPVLKPDLVIIGSAASYGFTERQWVDGTARVMARLAPITQHAVVLAGTPKLTFNGPECLQRQANDERCDEVLTSPQAVEVANYLNKAVKGLKFASVLNLNDLVCPDKRCSSRSQSGTVVFRDSQHLTDTFVREQADSVGKRLLRSLKTP